MDRPRVTHDAWASAVFFASPARFLDALLGARCRGGCGQRVFPRDVPDHERVEHAGDKR